MSIFIGGIEITDSTKIKVGATDVSEVYVGAKKMWPPIPVPAMITGHLIPGEASFDFESDNGFEVTQGTNTQTFGNGTWTVTSVNDASEIEIKLKINSGYFKFKNNNWLSLNLKEIGAITTLDSSFISMSNLEHFSCDANTSGVTNFTSTWFGCIGLKSFPVMDVSKGTGFVATWSNCRALTSFPALDVSSSSIFEHTWQGCTGLRSFPALDMSSGTRFNGTWQNCTRLTNISSLDMSSGIIFRYVWSGCTSLVCIGGLLDFRKLTDGTDAFSRCTSLTSPAPNGTDIRYLNNAVLGTWRNPNPCP